MIKYVEIVPSFVFVGATMLPMVAAMSSERFMRFFGQEPIFAFSDRDDTDIVLKDRVQDKHDDLWDYSPFRKNRGKQATQRSWRNLQAVGGASKKCAKRKLSLRLPSK